MASFQLTIAFFLLLLFSVSNTINAQNTENVHTNLIAIGYSWEHATSDGFLRKFLDPSASYPKKIGTKTFRIVTHKMEKWKDLLRNYNDVDAELIFCPQKQTFIWTSKNPDEMDLAEFAMLYHLINTTRNLRIIDSGNESSVRFSILIQNAAQCSLCTRTFDEIPASIYLCNALFNNKLLRRLKMICDIATLPMPCALETENAATHSWMPSIFASAAEHGHHGRTHHSTHQSHATRRVHHDVRHHAISKYRRKHHVYSKKYELLKLRRKQEAMKKNRREASDVLEVPIARRKLLCKYRKSCYETGIVPDTWNIYNILPRFMGPREIENITEMHMTDENDTKKEISEAELKLLCRYRKSCYEEVGAEIEKGAVNVQVVQILTRRFAIVLPPKKPKTIEEIAKVALTKIEEREKIASQRPIPKKVIIDKKLNEIEEEMKKRLACKYRKSCYDSGVLPELGSPFSNPLPRIYHFLRRQIRGSSAQEIIRKEFHELNEDEKRIYCKYRKSCYVTGEKPVIDHGQLFKYIHIVKKYEEIIPLEIRCKYRKSCYDTGILPSFEKQETEEEEISPTKPVQKVTSLYHLKLLCKYRIGCYRQKAQEPQNASAELFEEIAKLSKSEAEVEEKRETVEGKKIKPSVPLKKKPKKEREDVQPKEGEKKTKPVRKMSKPQVEKIEKLKDTKETKRTPEAAKIKMEKTEGEKPVKKQKVSELKKKTTTAVKDEKTEKTIQKSKRKKTKEGTGETEVKQAKKVRKVTTSPPATAKPQIIKRDTWKSVEKQKLKVKKAEKEVKEIDSARIMEEEELTKEKDAEEMKENEDDLPLDSSSTITTTVETPLATEKKVQPEFPRPENKTPEMLPKKVNIYDENLSALDIKLLCKYRKSCYEKGELPPILHAKTIKHLKEKDEQHKPLELRCKYRKSCYKTGKLPENLHENFHVVHLIEKKEEHKPLTLRCKYRKSCYETGQLPPIETHIFAFSTLQSFLNKYEEKELAEKEISEEERKLRCKYRKSCYETGILPQRLNQTVHVIASSIKEQYMSPQLKCKYRKSCYESMKLDMEMEKVRKKEEQKKPKESIVKIPNQTEPTIKYKEKEQKEKVSEDVTDEETESERLRKSKSKKLKSESDEEEYMQIEPLGMQLRPQETKIRPLSKTQKLRCKYRLKCYDGMPLHQIIEEKRIEKENVVNIKNFRRANGAICNIYYISCRKQAGLPIRERAPIGRNGRRLCRKKKKKENDN